MSRSLCHSIASSVQLSAGGLVSGSGTIDLNTLRLLMSCKRLAMLAEPLENRSRNQLNVAVEGRKQVSQPLLRISLERALFTRSQYWTVAALNNPRGKPGENNGLAILGGGK